MPVNYKSYLKGLGGLAIAAFLLFLIAVNFSAVESRYECNGYIAQNDVPQPLHIYFRLNEYRWWVGLWSDSDGSMLIEVPNQTLEFISHIKQVGDQLQLFESGPTEETRMKGNFSTLSETIAVNIVNLGLYDGACSNLRGR